MVPEYGGNIVRTWYTYTQQFVVAALLAGAWNGSEAVACVLFMLACFNGAQNVGSPEQNSGLVSPSQRR